MALSGFDRNYYLYAKLTALQASGAEWAGKTTADLEAFLWDNFGLTPETHYTGYGYAEGLAPNAYFDHAQYRLAKARDMVAKGQGADMASALSLLDSAWPGDLYLHYIACGAAEAINPSDSFDESAYLTQKLSALQSDASSAAQWAGKTIGDLRTFIQDAGMTVISHYLDYGAAEGLTVTSVPEDEKPGSDVSPMPHANVSIPPDLDLDWVDTAEIAKAPYTAIGQVQVMFGSQGNLGTGFMISPEHLLTNAHVVLNGFGELDSSATISFAPGLNGEASAAVRYDSQAVWVQSAFAPGNLPRFWPDDDLAVIRLRQPAGNTTGYLSLENSVNLSLTGKRLDSAGYSTQGIQQDNPDTPGEDYYQWSVSGTVDKYILGNGALDLSDSMGTTAGSSGSPLFYTENGTVYFAGVMSGSMGGDPVAAAIDTDSYNWILGILQNDGYYTDYSVV